MQGGGGALSGIEAQELKDLREKVPKLLRDNKDLTASEYIMRKLILAPLMFWTFLFIFTLNRGQQVAASPLGKKARPAWPS